MANIITLAALKAHLGIVGTGRDTRVTAIVSGLNAAIEQLTGRDWQQVARTSKKYVGNGTTRLTLRHYPMTVLSACSVDGVALDVTDAEVIDFDPANAVLVRTDGIAWPVLRGRRGIVVTYTGGPATIPADLTMAGLELGGWVYRASGGRGSVGAGGVSQTLWDQAMTALPTVAEILAAHADSARGYIMES